MPTAAGAHSLGAGYFAHRLVVRVEPEWVRIEYSTEIPMSVLQGEFVRAMLDEPPGTDGAAIRERLRREKADALVAGIEVVLNGARLAVEEDPEATRETRPNDEVFLLFRYVLRAPVQGKLAAHNVLVVRNGNYARSRSVYSHAIELTKPFGSLRTGLEQDDRFEIDPRTGFQWYFSGRHRNLHVEFDRGGEGERAPGEPARAGAGGASGEGDSTAQRLERFLSTPDWSLRWVLLALVVSFLLGAVHAISPGHGKTVVAAYLVGSRGRVRDAVVLGLTVTFTHTSTVVVLGIVALALSQYVLPEQLVPHLTFLSGALIAAVGIRLLVVRVRELSRERGEDGHEHEHEDGHVHAHAHAHAHGHAHGHGQRVGLRGLISLGISGGLVPCPSALVVLLAAIAYRRIALGLGMVVAFSAGLASVLIAIGILFVLATRAARKVTAPGAWARWLPVASAVVIVALGVALCARVLFGASLGPTPS